MVRAVLNAASKGISYFCVFSSPPGRRKWDSWGLPEWYDRTARDHPMFKAALGGNRKNAGEK
jgi:hypothetical protein